MSTWRLYLLRCGDGTLYCGIAVDVAARLALHEAGKGAKYTRGRGPLELVYEESCGSRSEALKRERAVKGLARAAKLRLIEGNANRR
ncbi:MAG TPA: GIY-YIG nuclease family protein [Holophagaceae bacterium]|nr:GIY-YIG nuclease family protein [Holophagaceae bacterium]